MSRIMRYTKEDWEYEADQRHGEVIVEAMNLKGATGVKSPGEESKSWAEEEEERLLEPQVAREYRAVAARANFLSLDRSDIQYATKEACRGMANPTVGDKRKMKRLARYLIEKPRVVWKFAFQEEPCEVKGFSDSDWAGCKKTAKSSSG